MTKCFHGLKYGKLQPLPVPRDRFLDIAMDFLTINGGPAGGSDMVMIIVERMTKYTALVPCKKTDSASQIAKLVIDNWFCRGFGLRRTITSDRDAKFTSKLWISLCKALNIKQTMSTSHHQQTDGQAAIGVRNTRRILEKMNISGRNWPDKISICEYPIIR
jgi:putative transposase